ncbi:hypothetical protein K488DRAFT_89423 [Vararia minispora EC-137]|uniref:Uncharacterized protein n=1 Tax=Vararia minispora EC-137 TaxID=1314806 RepID=A0ACB8QAY5_9AGAM|nr:hypothetical protein K488DRAFT_89423 [Vararia minispora EC-137]
MSGMHRRKSSREDDADDVLPAPSTTKPAPFAPSANANGVSNLNGVPSSNGAVPARANDLDGVHNHAHTNGHGHARTRTISTPPMLTVQPPTATTPHFPYALPSPVRNVTHPSRTPASPLRASFSVPGAHPGHARTRSVSAFAHTPPSPSPLSASFPPIGPPPAPSSGTLTHAPSPQRTHQRASSYAPLYPTDVPPPRADAPPPAPNPGAARRHARLHSRNLSVFFPRPGQTQTIAEDDSPPVDAPRLNNASPRLSNPTPPPRLGEGFTFGGRPPPDALNAGAVPLDEQPAALRRSRRGHHHKHSLSHNFFSFLEPGVQRPRSVTPTQHDPHDLHHAHDPHDPHLHVHRAPTPSSPSPISTASSASTAPFAFASSHTAHPSSTFFPTLASLTTLALGACVWLAGQQVGSLACTALGYWVVFDALGVGVKRVLRGWVERKGIEGVGKAGYGTARLEPVALFAQGVYLMFAAVYVFKETAEHLLLSDGDGHHHHPGDEDVEIYGLDFPLLLLSLALLSTITNALLFNNHASLLSITGTRLPPPSALLDPSRIAHRPPPTSAPARMAENPYSVLPVALAGAVVAVAVLVPASEHRACDLLLAAGAACAMFALAYPACVAIGAVLLQTAPARGVEGGRTEAFLRAMREIERHPHVTHLPPPHIWQLAPHHVVPGPSSSSTPPAPLVVALELRVAPELDDLAVLALTRWATGRCAAALGLSAREAAEWVTVGVVRG